MLRLTPQSVASLVLPFFMVSGALAANKDSADFTHKYEGGYPVGSGYQEFTDPAELVVPPSSDGDYLTFHSTVPTGNDFWYYDWSSLVSDSVGYTYEARVKINPGGPQGLLGAVQFYMTDGETHGGLDNPGTTMRLSQGGFNIPTPAGPLVLDGVNYADGQFHVVRAAQEPNSSDFTYWSDGVLLGTYPGGFAFAGNESYFGDGSGDIGGRLVTIDYVRFDNTGAYAPTPEPSGALLITLAGIGLTWSRRRN